MRQALTTLQYYVKWERAHRGLTVSAPLNQTQTVLLTEQAKANFGSSMQVCAISGSTVRADFMHQVA